MPTGAFLLVPLLPDSFLLCEGLQDGLPEGLKRLAPKDRFAGFGFGLDVGREQLGGLPLVEVGDGAVYSFEPCPVARRSVVLSASDKGWPPDHQLSTCA